MPVLDKPDFMRRYRYLMDNKHDGQQVRAQAPFVALICSVFAVASRFVEDPRLITSDNPDEAGMGMVYHERYVPSLFAAIPSNFCGGPFSALILHYTSNASMLVEHVQGFLLMSSFLCSINCLPQAWLLVGQAVRAAQDIGLHVSCLSLTRRRISCLSSAVTSVPPAGFSLARSRRRPAARSGGACTPSTGCSRSRSAAP